eukprot:847557-Pyramimonas_sp.AAC.1
MLATHSLQRIASSTPRAAAAGRQGASGRRECHDTSNCTPYHSSRSKEPSQRAHISWQTYRSLQTV